MRQKSVFLFLILAATAPAAVLGGGVEVTPFVGFRLGGDFDGVLADSELDESESFGLAVGIPLSKRNQLELLVSRQETGLVETGLFGDPEVFEVEVDYYQIGITHEWEGRRFRPFFVGSAGLAQFNPDVRLKSETRPAFSLGGGVKLFFQKHFGLRFDGRLYGSFFDGSGQLFCDNSGSCLAEVSGSLLLQIELAAGLTFKF